MATTETETARGKRPCPECGVLPLRFHAPGCPRDVETLDEGELIPSAVLDLVRWLAGLCMVQQKKRHEAIALPPEECREFVMMRWPIVQGLRNQMALEEIGQQEINKDNLNAAVEWLMKHQPASAGRGDTNGA